MTDDPGMTTTTAPTDIPRGSTIKVKSGKLGHTTSTPYEAADGTTAVIYVNIREDGTEYGAQRYADVATITVVEVAS